MKYADQVIDLMAAHRGREFKMSHIVRYVMVGGGGTNRHTVRVGVGRVLKRLREAGCVEQIKKTSTTAVYVWL